MSEHTRQLHLDLLISGVGEYPDLRVYKRIAQRAEAAKLDSLTVEDSLARFPHRTGNPEAFTLFSGLAVVTRHIGLVATASAVYNAPYHIGRKLATLDRISKGRAGWNISTAYSEEEGRNFGHRLLPERLPLGAEAQEFVDVARQLWDSWEDDALLFDKRSGQMTNSDKIRAIHYKGDWFSVEGPLNVPRPIQGYPVFVHHIQSAGDIEFAVKNAEIIVIDLQTVDNAGELAAGLRERIATVGRAPQDIRILQVLSVSPDTVGNLADRIEEWFAAGAVDGFQLQPMPFPETFDRIIEEVVPELQRRGLFRSEYSGATLRERYGLPRPINPFTHTIITGEVG